MAQRGLNYYQSWLGLVLFFSFKFNAFDGLFQDYALPPLKIF